MLRLGNASNKLFLVVLLTSFIFAGFWSCSDQNSAPGSAAHYTVRINKTSNTNAPSLQSFTHGVVGQEWLVFAGRTNNPVVSDNGGLHNIKGNYTYTSFLPKTFNKTIFVYDVEKDTNWSMEFSALKEKLITTWPQATPIMDSLHTVFINSNALVTQKDETLYLVGGYGYDPKVDTTFLTYNQVVKINIPVMISIVKGNTVGTDTPFPIRFGYDRKLISTGGELFVINDTLYLAGGHNFGADANNFQQYVSAVYPFTLKNTGTYGLDVNVHSPISDALDPSNPTEADNSAFRRRDAPIVPSLYYNHDKKLIQQGITFYAGVFQPGSPPRAWNNAIYVMPEWKKNLYYYDSDYGQDNHNVYSCPDFEAYDSNTKLIHTFLLGGIGTGKGHGGDTLSGFTNNSLHIQANIDSLRSRYTLSKNTFNSDTLFGAEAAMILDNNSLKFYKMPTGEKSEVIDLQKTFSSGSNSVVVGYIYGGIQAFLSNPQSFGPKKSASTNRIWKVTLIRNSN